jgi:hypothetical protein
MNASIWPTCKKHFLPTCCSWVVAQDLANAGWVPYQWPKSPKQRNHCHLICWEHKEKRLLRVRYGERNIFTSSARKNKFLLTFSIYFIFAHFLFLLNCAFFIFYSCYCWCVSVILSDYFVSPCIFLNVFFLTMSPNKSRTYISLFHNISSYFVPHFLFFYYLIY